MIKRGKKLFKESLSSVRSEIRDMFSEIKKGLEDARENGDSIIDVLINVQTWDMGAPVLVKGAYNYYSGDLRCNGSEFVDDYDSLVNDYMNRLDEEIDSRNEMLDDILNNMYQDVEDGNMDEDDYYEEQRRLMDDTCDWSIRVDLEKGGRREISSSMVVSVESGDADVLDTDVRSASEIERWCRTRTESRISRRRGINGIRRIRESRSIFEARDKDGFINLIKQIKPEAKNIVDTMPGYYFNNGFNDSNISRMSDKEASLYRLCELATSINSIDDNILKDNRLSFILTGLVKRINTLVELRSGLSAAKKNLSSERIEVINEFMKALKPIVSFIKKQGLNNLNPFDTNIF